MCIYIYIYITHIIQWAPLCSTRHKMASTIVTGKFVWVNIIVFPLCVFLLCIMYGYFKMGNGSCRIVYDTSLFTCKTFVLTMSVACLYRVHAVSGHHSA